MGGMTAFLLLLWLGLTASIALDLQKRISGGHVCFRNERRYHVKLVDSGNNFICGGSLISNQWILTAAHCYEMNMKAIVGVHPGPGQPSDIEEKAEVYRDGNNICHDIMLLKLRTPTQIPSLDLTDCKNHPNIGTEVQIAGHNLSVADPQKQITPGEAAHLQCAYIDVANCSWLGNPLLDPQAHEHRICARRPGVTACSGDSGGGLVYNGMIYGVISRGGDKVCAHPVILMDVCAKPYREWIADTTGRSFIA